MPFQLHPQLTKDCTPIGDLRACRVLLMNNRIFPWLILVPMRDNLRDLFELTPADYTIVMDEVRAVSASFARITMAEKINIAALGNMVPQLHIHVIARYAKDAAWPNPVWNSGIASEPYDADGMAYLCQQIRSELG